MGGLCPEIANQLIWHLSHGAQGRRSLARATGLGEIVVRRELERLRSRGLVEMDRGGTRLTEEGAREFAAVIAGVKEVKELRLRGLSLDRFALGALLSPAAEGGPTWQLRDLAIREGASGAVFITYGSSGLRFGDSDEPLAVRNPLDAVVLQKHLPGQEGDLIVLVFAPDRREAHLGLWRIIAELLRC